jgi:hypothetical protein
MAFVGPRRRVKTVGIVSTRLAGTDGVSLESEKWVQVMEESMEERRLRCYYFAGELDRPPELSYLAEKAHFNHPEIQEIQQASFGVTTRSRALTQKIQEIKSELKDHLYSFLEKFRIDLLMPENSLTIPMNSTPSRLLLGAGPVWDKRCFRLPEYGLSAQLANAQSHSHQFICR